MDPFDFSQLLDGAPVDQQDHIQADQVPLPEDWDPLEYLDIDLDNQEQWFHQPELSRRSHS